MSGPLPPLASFAEVAHWVIDELGALCPSPERLRAYYAHPQPGRDRDIRYHVEEAGCRICRAERPDPAKPS
ncbi:MAG: hypothetical protein ACUVUC_04790 [Thermoguttaceae bacterium]